MLFRRLLFAIRAHWTWRRGIRSFAPFCWGCGHIFNEDAIGVGGVEREDVPTLCLLCKSEGWRFALDGYGVTLSPMVSDNPFLQTDYNNAPVGFGAFITDGEMTEYSKMAMRVILNRRRF